jgi:hypothetical protein
VDDSASVGTEGDDNKGESPRALGCPGSGRLASLTAPVGRRLLPVWGTAEPSFEAASPPRGPITADAVRSPRGLAASRLPPFSVRPVETLTPFASRAARPRSARTARGTLSVPRYSARSRRSLHSRRAPVGRAALALSVHKEAGVSAGQYWGMSGLARGRQARPCGAPHARGMSSATSDRRERVSSAIGWGGCGSWWTRRARALVAPSPTKAPLAERREAEERSESRVHERPRASDVLSSREFPTSWLRTSPRTSGRGLRTCCRPRGLSRSIRSTPGLVLRDDLPPQLHEPTHLATTQRVYSFARHKYVHYGQFQQDR